MIRIAVLIIIGMAIFIPEIRVGVRSVKMLGVYIYAYLA